MVSKKKSKRNQLPQSLNAANCIKKSRSTISINGKDLKYECYNVDINKNEHVESQGLAAFCTQGECIFS